LKKGRVESRDWKLRKWAGNKIREKSLGMKVVKMTGEVAGLEIEKRDRKGVWRIVIGNAAWERNRCSNRIRDSQKR